MSPSLYALIVLFAINLMNFFDRQIIGGVAEGIRREWALSDTALGLLGTVFTLLYAVVGLPLGRLSDRSMRSRILAGGVFVWSLLTAASGLARNFAHHAGWDGEDDDVCGGQGFAEVGGGGQRARQHDARKIF